MSKDGNEDGASVYFALVILALVLIYPTFSLLNALLRPAAARAKWRRSQALDAAPLVAAEPSTRPTVSVRNVVLFFLYIAFFLLVSQAQTQDAVQFDPYAILGLDEEEMRGLDDAAAVKLAKKTYRKLSLLHHPDRNTGKDSAAATERFRLIAKAHAALTDPVARDNMAKYGHPDGRQSFAFGMALPSFLTENAAATMGVYLVLIIAIPGMLLVTLRGSKKKSLSAAAKIFGRLGPKLSPETDATALLGLLAESQEDGALGEALQAFLKRDGEASVDAGNLVVALESSLLVLDQLALAFLKVQAGKQLLAVLEAQPCLTQGVMPGDTAPLLQLPHVTPVMAKALFRQRVWTPQDLLKKDVRALVPTLSETEAKDVASACAAIPSLAIEAVALHPDADVESNVPFVDGETVRFAVYISKHGADSAPSALRKAYLAKPRPTATSSGLQAMQAERSEPLDAPPVAACAPRFPGAKHERWTVLLSMTKAGSDVPVRLAQVASIGADVEEVVFPVRRSWENGTHRFRVHVSSDSYVGCEAKADVKVVFKEAETDAELRRAGGLSW